MSSRPPRTRWKVAVAGAAAGAAELVRRRRAARETPPPPPVTTMSSPGQIADLQQAYGADMAAAPGPPGSGSEEP